MSELSSRPAREPVVYTLEQVSTIPEKQWHAFVLAVTETFWQCRRRYGRRMRISAP